MSKLPTTIDYKGYKIPTGTSQKDEAERRKIISAFYKKWFGENTEKRVKNVHLDQFIFVNNSSRKETQQHGGKSYKSTMTVLCLSYVLKHAVKTGYSPPKPNRSQRNFEKMLIMECVVPELRPYVNVAKLTVGIYKVSKDKVQYCLTAK